MAQRQPEHQGIAAAVFWYAGAMATLAAQNVLLCSRVAVAVFYLQVFCATWISRRYSGIDLLQHAGRAVFLHKSKDLRTEQGLTTGCAAFTAWQIAGTEKL